VYLGLQFDSSKGFPGEGPAPTDRPTIATVLRKLRSDYQMVLPLSGAALCRHDQTCVVPGHYHKHKKLKPHYSNAQRRMDQKTKNDHKKAGTTAPCEWKMCREILANTCDVKHGHCQGMTAHSAAAKMYYALDLTELADPDFGPEDFKQVQDEQLWDEDSLEAEKSDTEEKNSQPATPYPAFAGDSAVPSSVSPDSKPKRRPPLRSQQDFDFSDWLDAPTPVGADAQEVDAIAGSGWLFPPGSPQIVYSHQPAGPRDMDDDDDLPSLSGFDGVDFPSPPNSPPPTGFWTRAGFNSPPPDRPRPRPARRMSAPAATTVVGTFIPPVAVIGHLPAPALAHIVPAAAIPAAPPPPPAVAPAPAAPRLHFVPVRTLGFNPLVRSHKKPFPQGHPLALHRPLVQGGLRTEMRKLYYQHDPESTTDSWLWKLLGAIFNEELRVYTDHEGDFERLHGTHQGVIVHKFSMWNKVLTAIGCEPWGDYAVSTKTREFGEAQVYKDLGYEFCAEGKVFVEAAHRILKNKAIARATFLTADGKQLTTAASRVRKFLQDDPFYDRMADDRFAYLNTVVYCINRLMIEAYRVNKALGTKSSLPTFRKRAARPTPLRAARLTRFPR
jgi:hypothetical protein